MRLVILLEFESVYTRGQFFGRDLADGRKVARIVSAGKHRLGKSASSASTGDCGPEIRRESQFQIGGGIHIDQPSPLMSPASLYGRSCKCRSRCCERRNRIAFWIFLSK